MASLPWVACPPSMFDLLCACREGKVSAVARILDEGGGKLDLNGQDWNGQLPLTEAVVGGNILVVSLLLERGATVNPPGGPSQTVSFNALMTAAQRGQHAIAEKLIKVGANVNSTDRSKRTALVWAVDTVDDAMAALLLRAGADPNLHARSTTSYSPLACAAMRGSCSLVCMLVEAGARIHDTCRSPPQTAAAVALEFHRPHVFRELLLMPQFHPVPEAAALICAAFRSGPDIAREFLRSGVDVRAKSSGGNEAIHLACNTDSFPLVSLILEKGGSVNAVGAAGDTPLHIAACKGYYSLAGFLLAQGAEMNAVCGLGRTPLVDALLFKHVPLVRMLIAAGAHVNLLDGAKYVPLLVAAEFCAEAVPLLLNAGAVTTVRRGGTGESVLHVLIAAYTRGVAYSRTSSYGAAEDDEDETEPLGGDLGSAYRQALSGCVAAGVHIDTPARSEGGATPLQIATQHRFVCLTVLCLELGGSISDTILPVVVRTGATLPAILAGVRVGALARRHAAVVWWEWRQRQVVRTRWGAAAT